MSKEIKSLLRVAEKLESSIMASRKIVFNDGDYEVDAILKSAQYSIMEAIRTLKIIK